MSPGIKEILEGAAHEADRHVHVTAVGLRDQEGAAEERARSLVTEDRQQGDPLPLSLAGHGCASRSRFRCIFEASRGAYLDTAIDFRNSPRL